MPEILLLLHDLKDIRAALNEKYARDGAIGHDNALREMSMRIHEIVENAYGRARRAEATAATPRASRELR